MSCVAGCQDGGPLSDSKPMEIGEAFTTPTPADCNNIIITSLYTAQKDTIHWVTTMLATSKNVLFPGHNHLLTTCTYDPSLAGARPIIKVSGHQYWWLTGGYDLELRHFRSG